MDSAGPQLGLAARAGSPSQAASRHLPRDAGSVGVDDLCAVWGLRASRDPWREEHRFRVRVLRRGEVVCREGEPFRFIHPVLTGTLKVSAVSDAGGEQVFGLLRRGDVGGIDSIGRSDHRSTITALEPVRLALLPVVQWRRLAQTVPEVDAILERAFAGELDRQLAVTRLLAIANVKRRLAAFLLMLARRPDGTHEPELRLPLSRREMAQLLATTQETVCRALAALATDQSIGLRRGMVMLSRPEALQALTCGPARGAAARSRVARPAGSAVLRCAAGQDPAVPAARG